MSTGDTSSPARDVAEVEEECEEHWRRRITALKVPPTEESPVLLSSHHPDIIKTAPLTVIRATTEAALEPSSPELRVIENGDYSASLINSHQPIIMGGSSINIRSGGSTETCEKQGPVIVGTSSSNCNGLRLNGDRGGTTGGTVTQSDNNRTSSNCVDKDLQNCIDSEEDEEEEEEEDDEEVHNIVVVNNQKQVASASNSSESQKRMEAGGNVGGCSSEPGSNDTKSNDLGSNSSKNHHHHEIISSTTSYSISTSPSSSASSSLSTSPTAQQMAVASSSLVVSSVGTASTTTTVDDDRRKVEPLIINLNREPIRTGIKLQPDSSLVTPKITIKPIVKPDVEISNHRISHEDYANHHTDEPMPVIPKLHIKMNHHHYAAESHDEGSGNSGNSGTVPKLTIRTAASSSLNNVNSALSISNSNAMDGGNVVPKLTIKMDQLHHHSHHHHHHHHHSSYHQKRDSSSSPESVKITDDGTKIKIKKLIEPPLPKLTIKTVSLETNSSSSSSSLDVALGSGDRLTAIPKVTIKQTGINSCSSSSGSSSINAFSQNHPPPMSASSATSDLCQPATELQPLTVPKLTIKVPSAALSSSSEETTTTAAIPKLTIKSVGGENDEQSFQIMNNNNNETMSFAMLEQQPAIPKLKVMVVPPKPPSEQATQQPAIPKLTIKPVINPKTYGTNSNEFISSRGGGLSYSKFEPLTPVSSTSSGNVSLKPPNHTEATELKQPLEIATTVPGSSGPQSPRIILKINKNQNSIVSNTEIETYHPYHHREEGGRGKEENLLKRHLTQELFLNKEAKKGKLEEKIVAVIDLDDEDDDDEEDDDDDDDVQLIEEIPPSKKEENHVDIKLSSLKPEENGTIRQHRQDSNALHRLETEASTSSDCVIMIHSTSEETDHDRNGAADALSSSSCGTSIKSKEAEKRIENDVPEILDCKVVVENAISTKDVVKERPADDMETETPVKRGRGRPRKTPLMKSEIEEYL